MSERGKVTCMTTLREVRVVDEVVIRPRKPWTPTVHQLLRFLVAESVVVPEPIDLDDHVERVRFVEGDGGEECWPHQLSLAGVASAGELLRRVHDATKAWTPPPDAVWSVSFTAGSVICHGDPQPANMAWVDGRAVGLFDWDAARPGERIDDVAYALEWLAPFETDPAELRRRGFTEEPDRKSRIEAFLKGYGWTEPVDILQAVLVRKQKAITEVVELGAAGHEPHATWVAEGWPARWAANLKATRSLHDKI